MIFERYIFKKFFALFALAIIFSTLVLSLVDLFLNLWKFISNDVSPLQILTVFVLYMPKACLLALPLAVLFACSYVLSDLYAKNELTAIFASGTSLLRFCMPLLIASLLLSFASFCFENFIVVPSYHKKVTLQNELLKEEKNKNNENIVLVTKGGNIVYKADFYEAKSKTLYNLYVVYRDDEHIITNVLRANSANFDGAKWLCMEPVLYTVQNAFSEDEKIIVTSGINAQKMLNALDLSESHESFENSSISVEEVSVFDAKAHIDYLRRAGLPYASALADYYKKFASPFIVFIVVFLSIGLSCKTRKNVLLVSLLLSLASAVSYYIMQMILMLCAQFEYLPSLAGAFLPVVLYTALSIVLLKFTRT